ncbi:hypothetical protein P8452_03194 [Trifolium repens]|nr:hypothetical protein P8452_03194 [Trifolium repens]
MEKNHKILDWIVNYSAILTSLMHGRTCDCFGSDTGWCFVNATKAEPGVAQAEPETALDLIRAGALENATTTEPGATQSYSAAINWKI